MLRNDFDKVLQRNIDFTMNNKTKGLLLHIREVSSSSVPRPKSLELWDFPSEVYDYIDTCLAREEKLWAIRTDLEDDTIPSIRPYFGMAEHTAFLGGKVIFGGDTSYHIHPLENWDTDFNKLILNENNTNFKMLLDAMRYLKSREKKSVL